MSFKGVIDALIEQLSQDQDLRETVTPAGLWVGENFQRAPENIPYHVILEPVFEREREDSLTFDAPDEDYLDDRQTVEVENVLLIKCKMNTYDTKNMVMGTGRLIGIMDLVWIVKKAITKQWDLGLLNIQSQRFENTFYVFRDRFAEGQITAIFTEVLYNKDRKPAPFKERE